MTAAQFNTEIYQPAMAAIDGVLRIPRSRAADHLLLAIAGQESAWTHRYQLSSTPGRKGPARGFWQFERAGGVAGVMAHRATQARARALAELCGVSWDARAIWEALETDDRLAAGFARLLLWTDPRALPTTQSAAWQCYLRNWRPGKPHPSKWPSLWAQAWRAL